MVGAAGGDGPAPAICLHIYIALQMAGYKGDAHEKVNHTFMPIARENGISLYEAMLHDSEEDDEIKTALVNIPPETRHMLNSPIYYTGDAEKITLDVVERARRYIALS